MDLRRFVSLLLVSCIIGSIDALAPRAKLGKPHIVNGEDVEIAEVPYQLSIRRFFNHLCGASVIAKNYALTAAHCFEDRDHLIWYGVSGGSNHVKGGFYKFVRSITSHPKYDSEAADYDVAVVRIWSGFGYTRETSKIELVGPGSSLETGMTLVVSGWGTTSQFRANISETLQKAEVQVVKQSKCKEIFKQMTDRMFCAGVEDGGKDACKGDSGGPIVDLASGRQVGIVSWGIGCGNPERPGVYTDLSNSEIRQFIVDNSEN